MKKFLLTTATTFLMFFNQASAFELADLEGSWVEQDSDEVQLLFDKKGNWEIYVIGAGATEYTGIAKIKNNEVELIPNPKEDSLDKTKQIKRKNFKLKNLKLKISDSGNTIGTFDRYELLDKDHIPMMIIDSDKNGTNVRQTPNGKIIGKIPYINPTDHVKVLDNRIVNVKAQRGDWFLVGFGSNQSKKGYVHKSMIGNCAISGYAGEAYNGDGKIILRSSINGDKIITSTSISLVRLEAISPDYKNVKVSLIDKHNKKFVGWLHTDHFTSVATDCSAWK